MNEAAINQEGILGGAARATRYRFSDTPTTADFEGLADYLENAPTEATHPALRVQQDSVALGLRRMAGAPYLTAHQSAYQALRLFIH